MNILSVSLILIVVQNLESHYICRMKLLHLPALTLFLATSCQSEYEIQLKEAKQLVNQELELRNKISILPAFNADAFISLEHIQREIEVKSHLSGNKRLFNETLNTYKYQLIEQHENADVLLTKYP
jgi:hypothetical protein